MNIAVLIGKTETLMSSCLGSDLRVIRMQLVESVTTLFIKKRCLVRTAHMYQYSSCVHDKW